ncbi:MAG: hypothetical protein C0501_17100 [Isosphaera sp.]|nr:hypothetical protein [Isosphaera sp.]
MENQLTPPDDKTPEQIEAEMASTRESMTEKIAALENKVVGTVETAADTLSGTVNSVKSLISDAPGAVGDAVKKAATAVREAFDIPGHVRSHPWAAMGVSAGLGFLTGVLVFRGRGSLGYSTAVARPAYAGAPTATSHAPAPEPAAPSRPGMFGELFAMVGRKLREVAEQAIDSASQAVNQNVRDGVPKLVDAAADRLTPGAAAAGGRFRYGDGSDYTG